MTKTYYNEFDKKKCAALSQLMKDGHITKGDIDDRPIQQVQPDDLKGYDRCHFFAGVGLWDYALQLADWPTDRPVWTGSCPCQPFSTAGRQKGKADDRHLWPEWERLIEECKPKAVFGEQVSSSEVVGTKLEASFIIAVQRGDYARANKLANKIVKQPKFSFTKRWIDDVREGMEQKSYAFGSSILPACCVGAPIKGNDYGLWATPNTMDHLPQRSKEALERQFTTTRKGRTAPANLREQVNPEAYPNGSLAESGLCAPMESVDLLNPEFPCWLMGIPKEWVSSIVRGMQSCPK